MDTSHTMIRSPALPHHLHRFPRLTDCHRHLALVDLIQIPQRFPHQVPSSDISDAIDVELLEEELAVAGKNWRQIAQRLSIPHEWRPSMAYDFGLVVSVLSSINSLALKAYSLQVLCTRVSKRSPRRDRYTRCDHTSVRTRR
jgi:hypothetical protein